MRRLGWIAVLVGLSVGVRGDDAPAPTAGSDARLTVAVIGDYGLANNPRFPGAEAAVARMVRGWEPAFILTVGDNFYPGPGSFEQMDANVGQFYHDYLHPYRGRFGAGSPTGTNRFFPALGNHDVDDECRPYAAYFAGLPEGEPGNSRFYSFTWGGTPDRPLFQGFCLNGNAAGDSPYYRCPEDGITADSKQGLWLKRQLAGSKADWKVVYLHQPPYSSSKPDPADGHGSNPDLQWPYQQWGADLVLAGHEHFYERLSITDDRQRAFPYVVMGVSGSEYFTAFRPEGPIPGSQVRFNTVFGALRLEVTPSELTLEFWDAGYSAPGESPKPTRVLDRLRLARSNEGEPAARTVSVTLVGESGVQLGE